VNVWVIRGLAPPSEDFNTNFERLKKILEAKDFTAASTPEIFSGCDVLIDAIFGSGLSWPVEGIYAQAIEAINASGGIRIAVDIPSGLFADKHSTGPIIRAHHTVTFQLPKLAFLFPENYPYVGTWHLIDIGLHKIFIREATTAHHYLTKKSVRKILKGRSTFNHKGDFGRGLLIAGSYGKMGACVLAARAALRAGMGLLTVHIPGIGYSILQSTVPEAMASVDDDEKIFSSVPSTESFDVIGIGPGLGLAKETVAAFTKILASGKPMVIDADALNILSAHRELLHLIPAGSILTPHPREFERLTSPWKDDYDRLDKQIKLSKDLKSVVILKGAHSSMTTPDGQVYFNSTGNPGMATGGSGDVLTGVLTSLLAQHYTAEEAAILGVFLHGLSGDIAVRDTGMASLIASDLIDFLPMAFKDLARE
jgi:NAD(P)H-hydrate epimerase